MIQPEMIQMLLFLTIIGATSAYFARLKGRSAPIWFALGFFFGLFALVVLLFLPSLIKEEEEGADITIIPEQEWYYLDHEEQQQGPFSLKELKALFENGTLNETSYLWHAGLDKWEEAASIEALLPFLENATNSPS